jgi:hypothetical protein
MIVWNLSTPKAVAEHELLSNKLPSEAALLNTKLRLKCDQTHNLQFSDLVTLCCPTSYLGVQLGANRLTGTLTLVEGSVQLIPSLA